MSIPFTYQGDLDHSLIGAARRLLSGRDRFGAGSQPPAP